MNKLKTFLAILLLIAVASLYAKAYIDAQPEILMKINPHGARR
jgi:hypothetical protein